MPYQKDGKWFTDDHAHYHDGTNWVPVAPPAPPSPPPAPPAPPSPPPFAHTQPYYSAPTSPAFSTPATPGSFADADTLNVADITHPVGLPLGRGYLVMIEDIEASVSQSENKRLNFKGKTLAANGNIPGGYAASWGYTLSDKAIKYFGTDLQRVGITGQIPGPRNPQAMAKFLLEKLGGKVVVVDSVESKNSDLPNVSMVALHNPAAPQAAPAAAPPAPNGHAVPAMAGTMPPGPPPAAPTLPGVSFPTTPPPPGGSPFYQG